MVKYSLEIFESIGPEYAEIFRKKMGIYTVDDFYRYSEREFIEITSLDKKRINQFQNILDLFRVPYITPRDAEILYYADINSVEELAHRQAVRIFYKLKEIDEQTYLILLDIPTFATINTWIYYAKLLIKRIKYGLNIPMIKLPMINIDRASDLKIYGILTVEDFINRYSRIGMLRWRLGMSRIEFRKLFGMIGLLAIDGIDVYFADILQRAGIIDTEMLVSVPVDVIINGGNAVIRGRTVNIKGVRTIESDLPPERIIEPLTEDHIIMFRENLENMRILA